MLSVMNQLGMQKVKLPQGDRAEWRLKSLQDEKTQWWKAEEAAGTCNTRPALSCLHLAAPSPTVTSDTQLFTRRSSGRMEKPWRLEGWNLFSKMLPLMYA